MSFNISPLQTTWNYQTLVSRLTAIGQPDNYFNRNCYIKPDLSLGYFNRNSGIFKTAKFFNLTNAVYDINYEKVKKILLELKPQIEKTNNENLIALMRKAIFAFNDKAPRRLKIPEEHVFVQTLNSQDDSYCSPNQRIWPAILKRNPIGFYPTEFLTKPDLLKRDADRNLLPTQVVKRDRVATEFRYETIADLQSFEKIFNKFLNKHNQQLDLRVGAWDVHDIHFQNLALRLTTSLSDQELRHPKTKALAHLIRARNFAIGARSDIGWKGQKLKDRLARQLKQQEMEANWRSIVLRDWAGKAVPSLPVFSPGSLPQKISVTAEDTQTAVERLAKNYPANKICWVNMANAHRVGGGYQSMHMAQEEVVTTNSDAIVVLSNVGKLSSKGLVFYKQYLHIPPGGNYFHKTRFITGDQISCSSIAHPFADFREVNYSERQDYIDAKGKLAVDTQAYRDRIKLDMRGVLRTAIAEGQQVLILSATGCGAFEHDPEVESRAWKEVLAETEFKGRFQEIVFAILYDPKKPDNVSAFKSMFQ